MIENTEVTPANVKLFMTKTLTGNIVATTNQIEVAPSQYDNLILEQILYIQRGSSYRFQIETDVQVNSFAFTASSNYPDGYANILAIDLVSRDNVITSSAQLSWTSGYFNLTNGVDNQLPMDTQNDYAYGDMTLSNVSTNNASIQFVRTGVYMIDTLTHLFDLGTNMTLSSNLYTSTNGSTWTFLTIIGLRRYTGANTNQIQVGKYLLRVTSVPFYVQLRLNPSANSPFPANFGAPTYIEATRIGDI